MDANTKISQGSLINTLMKSLTSDNPQERRLAVQAVLIALPDQGPAPAPHKTAIHALADTARKLGPRTEARVQALLQRVDAAPG